MNQQPAPTQQQPILKGLAEQQKAALIQAKLDELNKEKDFNKQIEKVDYISSLVGAGTSVAFLQWLGTSAATGAVLPLSSLIAPFAIGIGGYLVLDETTKLIRHVNTRIDESNNEGFKVARSIIKAPINFGGSILNGFFGIADENSKGVLRRFFQFLEKRGEGDIPKELKMVLDVYEKGINLTTLPIKGTFHAFGAVKLGASLLQQMANNRKTEKLDKEIEEEKKVLGQVQPLGQGLDKRLEIEKERAELENIREAGEIDRLNFEKNFLLMAEEEGNLYLTSVQSKLNEGLLARYLPPANPPTPPLPNYNEYKEIFLEDNLIGKLGLDLSRAENPVEWNNAIIERENINKFLRALGRPNGLIQESSQPQDLMKLYYFLKGDHSQFTDDKSKKDFESKLISTIDSSLGTINIHNIDDLLNNPIILQRILEELLYIYKKINIDITASAPTAPQRGKPQQPVIRNLYEEQMDRMDRTIELSNILLNNADFPRTYYDNWLGGAAVEVGGRDALEPQNSNDLVGYFKWVKVPIPAEVDIEINRVNGLVNQVNDPNFPINLDSKLQNIINLKTQDQDYEDNLNTSLDLMTGLNPKQMEEFVDIVMLPQILTVNRANLQQAVNSFFDPGNDPKVNINVYNTITSAQIDPEVKVIIDNIFNSENKDILFSLILDYSDMNLKTSPIQFYIDVSPYFELLNEYYNGDFKSFNNDLANINANFAGYRVDLTNRMNTLVSVLIRLRNDVATNYDSVRNTRNSYLKDLIHGKILIEQNLNVDNIRTRDHQGLIADIANLAVQKQLISSPADLLTLVPDPNLNTNIPIDANTLTINNPFVKKLEDVASQIFILFLSEENDTEKLKLALIFNELELLGFSGKVKALKPPDVGVDFNHKLMAKYLNGLKVANNNYSKTVFAKHPYGFVA